jgi:hypothetical protein
MVPIRMSGLTSFILILVASSTMVAMLAMYAGRNYSTLYLLSCFAFFFIVKFLAERIRLRIPPRKSSSTPIVLLSGGAFALSVGWIMARGGLSSLNFDLAKIYSVREVAIDRYFVGPFVYIINWAQKVFGTTLLALGLAKGQVLLIAAAVAGQIFFYAALGQKTPMAMIFFVFAAIAVAKYRPSAWILNASLVGLILASQILFEHGFLELISLFVMRIFFSPAGNNIAFFEFFSENEFVYFSTSILGGLIDYQYSVGVLDLISIHKMGNSGVNPNTGVFGTGYMHMGYLGLLVYALISGLILSLFESLARTVPKWVPLAIGGPPLYILFTSTDLPVALMTNGGIIAILILFLWPAEPPALGKNSSRGLVASRLTNENQEQGTRRHF